MKKKWMILPVLIAAVLIVACTLLRKNDGSLTDPAFPTATSHFLFRSGVSAATPALPASLRGTPTVASIFQSHPTPIPTQSIVETAAPTPVFDETDLLPTQYFSVTVYQDALNPNWEVQKDSGVDFDLNTSSPVYQGRSAIAFTPQVDYGSLFFTVSEKSQEIYRREQVSMVSFWLYSGEKALSLDQLFVTIVGSNSQPYWSADDHSVTVSDDLPTFSETRLYFLGFNYEIPAQTWVPVEIDLDSLVHDPDYEYVTGFYLKTEAGFSRTLWIDDIQLVMLDERGKAAAAEITPSPADSQAAGIQKPVTVQIDTKEAVHQISSLIYGVSGAPADYLQALRPALNSWGGNPSTRYNWQIGHAWNTGRDYFYQNTNYGVTRGSASDDFVSQSLEAGAQVRISLPTLGWVAKNDDENTCSFPLPGGGCGDADGASCLEPGPVANSNLANVPSYLSTVTAWVQHLVREQSFNIRFLAMDNEPELWGVTHYDVHPKCTTYDEILKQYLTYATAVHGVAPQAELAGPVTSGWYYYWNSANGKADKFLHANRDFLPWFLGQVRQNDLAKGWRSLHVLDLHFYPEGVYNDQVDNETASLRLRSTHSLWDKTYVDESWIDEPIYLIPRMKALIEEHYPGTKLGLSEWNWGADETMNGALAIADVLGIFGREDLYYAAYWRYPPLDSPGFFAFKMYTNFDGRGGRFGDTSVLAQSSDVDLLGSYAALDSATGDLHVMLVNRQVDGEFRAQLEFEGFVPDKSAELYRYDAANPEGITKGTIDLPAGDFSVALPPYSITLLIIHSSE